MSEKNKKSEILKAAYGLFIENGYDNTSMKMIANKAGVVQSHIYAFFDNKEALFEEALHMAQDSYQTKMYAAVQKYADLPPEEFAGRCAAKPPCPLAMFPSSQRSRRAEPVPTTFRSQALPEHRPSESAHRSDYRRCRRSYS